ncbi:MAG: ORF6N domain-containing protein [Candidatus Omnitrophica bacterium]|nr:ORF6N domain-containing protein [Candidatus Omnitrophota bacterium]
MSNVVSAEIIATKILLIRGKRVMLDKDLAKLYEVNTNQLTRQVRRNMDRFPEDFMFQLTKNEFKNLICQFGTSSWGGTRKLPLAFTEQGIAMLSGILHSKMAVQVNIQIMRAFIQFKRILLTNTGLRRKIEGMEKKYDKQFAIIFQIIKQLLEPPPLKLKPQIGFHAHIGKED